MEAALARLTDDQAAGTTDAQRLEAESPQKLIIN
jgi:hypothetical protein